MLQMPLSELDETAGLRRACPSNAVLRTVQASFHFHPEGDGPHSDAAADAGAHGSAVPMVVAGDGASRHLSTEGSIVRAGFLSVNEPRTIVGSAWRTVRAHAFVA